MTTSANPLPTSRPHLSAGNNPPEDIDVMVEVPAGGSPVKYEYDQDSQVMRVDRIVGTAMFYPAHYGFIPSTLAEDGDPVDVMLVGRHPLIPGCVIRARPVGVLVMTDEKGRDEKILAVPHPKVDPYYGDITSYRQLPASYLEQIKHFFVHYKDLEPGKWVKVEDWQDADHAKKISTAAIKRMGH